MRLVMRETIGVGEEGVKFGCSEGAPIWIEYEGMRCGRWDLRWD